MKIYFCQSLVFLIGTMEDRIGVFFPISQFADCQQWKIGEEKMSSCCLFDLVSRLLARKHRVGVLDKDSQFGNTNTDKNTYRNTYTNTDTNTVTQTGILSGHCPVFDLVRRLLVGRHQAVVLNLEFSLEIQTRKVVSFFLHKINVFPNYSWS